MARLLGMALVRAGHRIEVLSRFSNFLAAPDPYKDAARAREAGMEVDRIAAAWGDTAARPEAILAYHLHYKAPDRVGLPLARRFGLPYLTAEASYARKRDEGPWAARQAEVVAAVRAAAVNLCFTANDRAGLMGLADPASLVDLPPFIDGLRFEPAGAARPQQGTELVTVAMMRPGDKLESYRFLAAALHRLSDVDWRLTIVGNGPMRADVEALFAGFGDRVRFLGSLGGQQVAERLRAADLFVWPGFNEAFGLCYLEAQACGLPAVAVLGEGTPSVIRHGETGWLTPPDEGAYADAIGHLLREPSRRRSLGAAASRFVHGERGLRHAAAILDAAVRLACRRHREAVHG